MASLLFLIFLSLSVSPILSYRPGDIVPTTRSGQYHGSRTVWQDLIGRQCPVFAVNREVLVPIAMPTGYTGADPYKISFQVGHEKFIIPWLFLINRKSSEVPMIDVNLRYTGQDLHGVTAKVVDMPHHYIEVHQDIRKQFWDPNHWPKHVLVRYTWVPIYFLFLTFQLASFFMNFPSLKRKEPSTSFTWKEESEIDVYGGFYVLFGSGLCLSFILAIYVLQSSQDKLARFVRETVAESSAPGVGVAKVE